MLHYRDAEMARTANVEPPMRRLVERSAIAMTIGEAMGLSESQAYARLSIAETLRDRAPRSWDAFRRGEIDLTRVRDIAHTIERLKRPESIERLDARVIDYATDHTAAELRVWLRRFVQRVESDLAVERAETELANRHVSIKHVEDGMAWTSVYGPSHQAAAIAHRLRREARKPLGDDDTRTIAQREADLVLSWCTNSEATNSVVDANIAVMIDADVLAGAIDGFAESSDGQWAVPAGWITDVASTGNTFWHRMVREPVTGDVLSHEYVGRFSPDVLDIALAFRDGVCQAPGCMVPAQFCDIDHRDPWPNGATNAANLGPLCRRHHIFKSHGVLHWSIRPRKAPPQPIVIEIYRDEIPFELAA